MNALKVNESKAAAQLFAALQAYETLKQAKVKRTHSANLSFNDIAHCAMNPASDTALLVRQRINENLDYFRKYRFVLKQISSLESPMQAAASTQERLLARREEQFELSVNLMPDDNAFVTFSLLDESQKKGDKRAFLHCELEGRMELVQLNKDEEGKFIAVLDAQDEALQVLININTHLYLSF